MLDFKNINFHVKTRDIHRIGNKNFIDVNVFGYENKKKYTIYGSKKCCEEKHVDLLLRGKREKSQN